MGGRPAECQEGVADMSEAEWREWCKRVAAAIGAALADIVGHYDDIDRIPGAAHVLNLLIEAESELIGQAEEACTG